VVVGEINAWLDGVDVKVLCLVGTVGYFDVQSVRVMKGGGVTLRLAYYLFRGLVLTPNTQFT
jgi:hypothetical protein